MSAQSTPITTPSPSIVRRQRLVGAFGLVAAIVVVIGIVWWQSDSPPDPPIPADVVEADVRAVLEASRAKVLDQPRSSDAWGDYGTILLAHLFDRDAETCFVEATRLNPKDPRWPYARAQIALKRSPETAVELLRAAVDAATFKAQYRQAVVLTLAETLLERGEVDSAAELFQQEISANPQDPRALLGAALVARARNDDAAAESFFNRVRYHPSCRKQATAQLAQLALLRGDAEAARNLEGEANALDADPPWPDPYLDHVVTLQVGSRGRQRKIAFLERDGEFEQALAEYQAELRVKRTSQALTGTAVNMARLKQYEPAIGLLREAVNLGPGDSNAHYTLALVLFTRAEKQFVADPQSADAAKAFAEVVEQAKRTADLKPDHSQAYLFWGLSLLHLGDAKSAIEPLKRGLTSRPDGFELHLALGQALAATGDRTAAEARFRTAKAIKPADPRPARELEKLKGK